MTGRGLAFAGALLAAVAVHAGVFAVWEPALSGGAQSAGAGGAALVSVAPSSAAMEARVADWERPPEVATAQPQMPQPETPPEAMPPKPQDAPPRIAATAPALTAPPAPDAALPAQADPAPPEMPRPVAKPKPPAPKPAAPKAPAKAKASRPAQAQPDLRAKGQGGTAAAGNNQAAPSATLSAGQVRSLMGAWGGQIRARIERHKIPPEGVGAGRVLLALNVARDGRLLGVSVAKSSGKAALDRAAVEAVRRAGRFPVAPKGLGEPRYSFTLPMAFR